MEKRPHASRYSQKTKERNYIYHMLFKKKFVAPQNREHPANIRTELEGKRVNSFIHWKSSWMLSKHFLLSFGGCFLRGVFCMCVKRNISTFHCKNVLFPFTINWFDEDLSQDQNVTIIVKLKEENIYLVLTEIIIFQLHWVEYAGRHNILWEIMNCCNWRYYMAYGRKDMIVDPWKINIDFCQILLKNIWNVSGNLSGNVFVYLMYLLLKQALNLIVFCLLSKYWY